jgi:hypothetical protein
LAASGRILIILFISAVVTQTSYDEQQHRSPLVQPLHRFSSNTRDSTSTSTLLRWCCGDRF